MNRRTEMAQGRKVKAAVWLTLIVIGLVATFGCKNIVPRGQSPDTTAMKFSADLNDTVYVGNLAAPWGINQMKVDSIALVNRLDGTGSNPRSNDNREHLVAEMHSYGVPDVDEYLASKDNSMVLVKGFLPPAAQKGDRFDLYLIAPPQSDTKSLENGFMMQSRLRTMARLGGGVREGHVAALGSGSVVVNEIYEPSSGDAGKIQAIIPGGGVVTEPRPIGLAIERESHSFKNAKGIERAINARFTTLNGNERVGVAEPKNDKLVEIQIPKEYKHNTIRFFRVLASIAINETANDRLNRLQRCEREMNEPGMAKISSLRLEGMGEDAIPSLKRTMRSDDPEVRFYAAQSLTYLGVVDGVPELEAAAKNEPAFRWHALTALATCNHPEAEKALERLLDVSSAETRYGAYHSLHLRTPDDQAYVGELLGNAFHLVVLPTTNSPMIHVSKRFRSEIVMFGSGIKVDENFLYVERGLTIKAKDSNTVEVIRYLTGRPEVRFTCSTDLQDMLPKLVKSGANYGTIIKLLKEAQLSQSLNAKLVINALPDGDRTYDRSRALTTQDREESDRYVSDPLPSMFDSGDMDASSRSDSNGSAAGTLTAKSAAARGSDLPPKRRAWSIIPNLFR